MINQTLPQVLALAPKGLEGIGVVVAACRASALGIVDLCSVKEGDSGKAVRQISRLGNGYFGVRVQARQVPGASWLGDENRALKVVCVAIRRSDEPSIDAALSMIHASGRLMLGEVTSKAEIKRAIAGGVDGLIVAGNEAGGWGGADSSFVLLQGALAEGSKIPVWVRGGIGPHVAAGCVAAGAAGVVLTVRSSWPGNRRLSRRGASELPGGTAARPRWSRPARRQESAFSPCRLRQSSVLCNGPPRKEAMSGNPLFATTSAGGMASVCPSVKTRPSRKGWPANT